MNKGPMVTSRGGEIEISTYNVTYEVGTPPVTRHVSIQFRHFSDASFIGVGIKLNIRNRSSTYKRISRLEFKRMNGETVDRVVDNCVLRGKGGTDKNCRAQANMGLEPDFTSQINGALLSDPCRENIGSEAFFLAPFLEGRDGLGRDVGFLQGKDIRLSHEGAHMPLFASPDKLIRCPNTSTVPRDEAPRECIGEVAGLCHDGRAYHFRSSPLKERGKHNTTPISTHHANTIN